MSRTALASAMAKPVLPATSAYGNSPRPAVEYVHGGLQQCSAALDGSAKTTSASFPWPTAASTRWDRAASGSNRSENLGVPKISPESVRKVLLTMTPQGDGALCTHECLRKVRPGVSQCVRMKRQISVSRTTVTLIGHALGHGEIFQDCRFVFEAGSTIPFLREPSATQRRL